MYWSRKLLVCAAWCGLAAIASADVADDDFRVATRHFSRQRWQPAAIELSAFIQAHRDDARAVDAHYLLAESLVQMRRYAEARQHLVTFLQQVEDHRFRSRAEFRAAEAAFHMADVDVARTELEAFREQHPDDPLRPYAAAYLGDLALEAREGQRAIAMYSEALSFDPVPRLAARCQFGMAESYERLGDVEQAIRLFRVTATQDNQYSAQAQFRIAMLHFHQDDYDDAESLLKNLATTARGDLLFETQYWLGAAQVAQQKWADAVTTLRDGLTDLPAHRLAAARRFSLAEALRKGGLDREGEATRLLQSVFQLDPPAAWSDDAGQLLAQSAWEANDLAGVAAIAGRFHERFPTSPLVGVVRQLEGRALLKQQDFTAAVAVFEQLLGEDVAAGDTPDSATDTHPRHRTANRYYLAIAYLGGGRPADVLRVLPADGDGDGTTATDLSDGLRVARASALLALGRHHEAIEPLQTFVAAHAVGTDSVDCHMKLIVALGETGQWYAAAESFELFRERHSNSSTLVTTATLLAELAMAEGVHDVAEPLFRFLAGDETSDSNPANENDAGEVPATPAAHAATAPPRPQVLSGLSGLARSQFARELWPETDATTARLLALLPPDDLAARTLFLRGRMYEAKAQPDAALECYQLICRYDPRCEQASSAQYAAARILTRRGDREAACQHLEELLRDHADFAHRDSALYQLAWLRLETGHAVQAERHFAELVREHPRSPLRTDATFRLARRAATRRDAVQANRWIDELLFGVASGEAASGISAGSQPHDDTPPQSEVSQIVCHALYLQGKLAVDAGNWLAALRSYHQILEEYPQSELLGPAMFWSAEAHFHLADNDQAEALLVQLAATADDQQGEIQAMIPLRRAQIAAHRRQWHDALELAQEIEPHFPEFSLQFEVDYLIGRCLSTQARFSVARQYFRKVINSPFSRKTETAAMAQWMIGETYFHQSKFDDAIRAYYRVDALHDQPQWRAAALLQAAKCHELNDQWQVAHQLYAQLRNDFPTTTFAAEATKRLRVASRDRPR